MLNQFLSNGGPMMWLILITSAAAVAVFVERVLHYHRAQINSMEFLNGVRNVLRRDNVVEAISICYATPGPVARLVKVAILNRDKGRDGVREALEETGLTIEAGGLVPFAHWTPPDVAVKRFLTWFFVAQAPPGEVSIDLGEIHDQAWMSPVDAMQRRNALEIELLPPTWVTLERLATFANVQSALEQCRGCTPERFATRIGSVPGGGVTLWQGDAAYEGGDVSADGPRHRLWMMPDGWRYERR